MLTADIPDFPREARAAASSRPSWRESHPARVPKSPSPAPLPELASSAHLHVAAINLRFASDTTSRAPPAGLHPTASAPSWLPSLQLSLPDLTASLSFPVKPFLLLASSTSGRSTLRPQALKPLPMPARYMCPRQLRFEPVLPCPSAHCLRLP